MNLNTTTVSLIVTVLLASVCMNNRSSGDTTGPAVVIQPARGLHYYGHYWVDSKPYGSHLEEVGGHCNVHWVEGTDGLKKCAARKRRCILQVRWEFFAGGAPEGGRMPLRDDHEALWSKTAEAVEPYIEYVEAFYMCDEPYWAGVAPEDLDTATSSVKERFPNKPIMVVFATPSFKPGFRVPAKADWLGFDRYEEIDEVVRHLKFLKSRMLPHQELFLVPQSFLNKAATDDRALAQLNWDYLDLAKSEPLVIGLLNYGLFTNAKPTDLPLTLEAQRKIGESITNKSAPRRLPNGERDGSGQPTTAPESRSEGSKKPQSESEVRPR